jgi:hypothetical protein
MSAGRRYFSVESWLRKANADESAECATVGPAASVGNAVNPAIDMTNFLHSLPHLLINCQ